MVRLEKFARLELMAGRRHGGGGAAAREERARALRPVQDAAAAVARRAALDLTVVPPLPTDAILRATCDVEGNRRDPFGDGDQSLLRIVDPRRTPITDPEMQALKNLWCDAGDFFPAFFAAINACGYQVGVGITREPAVDDEASSRAQTRLSPFMLSCALGDVGRVQAALAAARAAGEEATSQLLERRETNLRIPPLHAVIIGANNMATTEAGVKKRPPWSHAVDHVQVARLLLDAGARADAKDLCGYTMLHRVTSAPEQTWGVTLEIGMLLIDSRADPNANHRFGSAPLAEVAMNNKVACALMLLEAGADPLQSNALTFETPLECARLYPDLLAAFSHATTRKSVTGTQRLHGRPVVLCGLRKAELNGKQGVCGRLYALKQRYAVTVRRADGSNEDLLIQPKNLRSVRGLQDQRVVLVGLSREELNGKQGLCGAFDEARGRYAVTLDDGGAGVNVKPENLEAAGLEVTCQHCGVTAVRMDKCSKCFKTHYCSASCVEAGREAHAASCKASRAGQTKLDPRSCGPHGVVIDMPAGRQRTTIVKVQVPLPWYRAGGEQAGDMGPPEDDPIMVYNCKHDLDFMVVRSKCPEGYAALRRAVCCKDKNAHAQLNGRKAYLSALCHPDGTVTIDCTDPLPPQNW